MGASVFRSAHVNCELAVENVRETFQKTKRNKKRARAMIRMLKLAVKPKHVELLYRAGATDICVEILEEEPRGSPMRELSLVAMLCLTLDPFVRRDIVESNRGAAVQTVFRIFRQERPSSSVKYAAIAVLHSLSRDERNLSSFFISNDVLDSIMDSIAYESEGSSLRKLACEIVHSLSELPDRRGPLQRSFIEVAPRVLIGEMGRSSAVLELVLETLANLAIEESNHKAIIDERVVTECALTTLESRNAIIPETRKARLAALRLFYRLAMGSNEIIVLRLARMPRLVQACVDYIFEDGKASSLADEAPLTGAKILHVLSAHPASRLELFTARNLAEALYQQSATNVFARMAFVNITGAFDADDEENPERKALLGCEDMDDLIVELVRKACPIGPDRSSEAHADVAGEMPINDDEGGNGDNDGWELCSSALLTLSVLLRRKYHLDRLSSRVLPLVVAALDRAITRNDARAVAFDLACLRLLIDNVQGAQMDDVLGLLGRVQQKVHPTWRPLRLDAERLVSGLSSSRGSSRFSRLKPIVDILERVLDDDQRGYTRSLDVPLSSLTRALTMASRDEKAVAEKSLMKLIPRALKKALSDKDIVSAQYAFDLFEEVVGTTGGDVEWDAEKAKVSATVRDILQNSKTQFPI